MVRAQIMLIEDENVDEGIDDEAFEVQRPNVAVVGRERPSLRSDTMLHLEMPTIELGVIRA